MLLFHAWHSLNQFVTYIPHRAKAPDPLLYSVSCLEDQILRNVISHRADRVPVGRGKSPYSTDQARIFS